jgi:plastocyanin
MPSPRTAVLVALMAAAGCSDATRPDPGVLDVYTPGNTFSPFTATIVVGGTVRFNIFGDDHNVIFTPGQAGAPADINVVRNVIVERIFSQTGDFAYSCTVHPGMTGEIVVR